ncbi:alanine racemase [Kibdelosporangium aridum]|nr:alanine racemase [Kibdelosporangium aridum]
MASGSITGRPGQAVVDRDRLTSNVRRFHAKAATAGVAVRAHVKGHRVLEIAQEQVAAGATGIAVTQAREVRHYAAAGIRDIVVAYPWNDPWRWQRFAEVAGLCDLTVHVNSPDAVRGLDEAAGRHGVQIGVRIDMRDIAGESSLDPQGALDVARVLGRSRWLRPSGVTGYRGLASRAEADRRDMIGREFAEYLVGVADLLHANGLICADVCVGGTPICDGALSVPGVTEVCAGAYALQDAGMALIGVCSARDVALSLRTEADAARLHAGLNYPWMAGDDAGTRIGDRWIPAHICPVVHRLPAMETSDGASWMVAMLSDRRQSAA